MREAKKKGLDKNADVKNQMDLAAQTVLVRAYVADWIKANPIPDAALRKEYDTIKSQMGDKEYKVRHILVEKEDEAKEIIVELQKGDKFEKLAERSKDTGSKANGGDLDWNAPGNFVKPFSDAMVKLPKGKFTATPVQTQFGWHVIEVTDIRDAKIPSFDEVKPQLQQRMQGQYLDNYFKELRAKNGLYRHVVCEEYVARWGGAHGGVVRSPKDFVAGLMFIAVGIAAIVIASNYTLGTAARMGPGYFPRILGILMIVLGAILALRSLQAQGRAAARLEMAARRRRAGQRRRLRRHRQSRGARAVDDPLDRHVAAPRATNSGRRKRSISGDPCSPILAVGVWFVIGLKLQSIGIWPGGR